MSKPGLLWACSVGTRPSASSAAMTAATPRRSVSSLSASGSTTSPGSTERAANQPCGDHECCADDGRWAVVQVRLQVEFEAAASHARFEIVGVGAGATGVERRLLAGQLLLLDFVGALVPVTDLGLEALTYLRCVPSRRVPL